MITRNFNLYLNAGHSVPLVINVNQYDSGEQWVFTLYNADGTQYTPSTGAIVGIKSDGLGIINSGSVVDGKVVINETQQMTAAVGKAVFELVIDDGTHGTANFIVLVEEKPGNNADLSETDISMIEQAIEAASNIKPYGSPLVASTVAGMTDHDKVYVYVGSETGYTSGNWYYWDGSAWTSGGVYNSVAVQTDTTLTLSGVAADAKKTGDEISDLKSAIQQSSGLTADVKQALMDFANAVAFKSNVPLGQTYIDALEDALYPPADLVSISAVYTQSGDVYPDTSLDDLKTDLVVTAHYDNSTTEIVTTYTLSGTLTVGTSVITVSYGGKTTTFNVTVSSDGLIYSLVDHVFDGTINTQVDSGVKLLETDQSFTILIDLMTTTAQQSSPSWRLLHCMDTNARGINFGRGVNGGVVEKWMSVYEEISSNDFANLSGSHKVVVTHEAGSNSATYMYRLGTNAVNSRTVSDSAFYANDTTLYIGGSPGNNRALTGTGTVKIYDSVLSQARINEFLGV